MSGLALHTTSPQLGLAVIDSSGNRRSQTWDLGRDTSSQLHSLLAEFIQPLSWKDFQWLAVACGPGGFTGTRIGMVTARTLGQQLDLPVFPISTLAAVAWSNRNEQNSTIAVEMPAQRGQVFGAVYQIASGNMVAIVGDRVFAPEDWQTLVADNSYSLVPAVSDLGETVSSILDLAYLSWQEGDRPSWSDALPFYGQHPVLQH